MRNIPASGNDDFSFGFGSRGIFISSATFDSHHFRVRQKAQNPRRACRFLCPVNANSSRVCSELSRYSSVNSLMNSIRLALAKSARRRVPGFYEAPGRAEASPLCAVPQKASAAATDLRTLLVSRSSSIGCHTALGAHAVVLAVAVDGARAALIGAALVPARAGGAALRTPNGQWTRDSES